MASGVFGERERERKASRRICVTAHVGIASHALSNVRANQTYGLPRVGQLGPLAGIPAAVTSSTDQVHAAEFLLQKIAD